MPKVLVTGGTGFIAGHCIKQLLERGYDVVTTVRNPDKGAKLVTALTTSSRGKLSYDIVKDVAQKGAFDEVIKSTPDFDYVLHTASPFHFNVQDPVKDFLEPAVTGTTSILEAIKDNAPAVKRVVITSSFAAINHGSDKKPPFYDESVWNPITWDEAAQDKTKAYRGSKTLAERAAWTFMDTARPHFDLVTINPSLVFGPAAHLSSGDLDSLNTSNLRILHMIQGEMNDKLDPTGFYSWVDVRDVAIAHVRALEVPGASSNRFLLLADYHTNKRIAKIIASMGPQLREKLPANLDEEEDDLPPPGERYLFSNKRSIEVLGIEYTSLDKSVKDTVQSLLELGA
ncbi:methylglyoxal reductase (NADPH-dependent) gre2 [Elasticomyces elasticus]|uniref:Methylglyoxal reductase (NADPH-dependent) gre2 n=1 Tax=Exophiala sideris TaxID=1016849 RepID=A0ABR0JL66_9EURO|nr:methylglyoxal reductase (NADPH-dependent) gre2 [Elasticomyces elasticus]KAK5036328.1 methylglyoxal reductase (NADPH-dependent) gre2 [Exophiala sideris]KAK5041841.1 methylglyoxal reductase (NADPH-dependent) gre2 [Exophiala sideris]KAK5066711.1 methylglyoxal reductase (NADPH-dependent) gre2 [Exophiala sideris]KAK5184769.1 methylglyoxal reductase (NADPH-dependent) gre2 [Eurotiomycetes sp. CCFEE 6388]